MTDHTASSSANPQISSKDVNGTRVFSPRGEKLGHIDELMIDKPSGKVAYAVLAFGGILGMGEEHHPIPWSKLRYDTDLDGYVTDITPDQLQGAPARRDDWRRDRRWEEDYFSYFGAVPYWV
ncbi:MAG: PRC-barrel domain-containing protein [Defluviimonas sp.]|nr:PRC-barrel domain-containing protein [Defluviimonas sp.]